MQEIQEEEALNGVRFQAVMAERQLDRLAGHRTVDETAMLQASVSKLEKELSAVSAEVNLLNDQVQIGTKDLGESSLTSISVSVSQGLGLC